MPRKDTSRTVSKTDFFNEESRTKAAKAAGLKEGEILSLSEAVDKLNMPPMDRKEFNARMDNVLSNYRTVQASTGMTVSDAVSAVDSVILNRSDAKRLAYYLHRSRRERRMWLGQLGRINGKTQRPMQSIADMTG